MMRKKMKRNKFESSHFFIYHISVIFDKDKHRILIYIVKLRISPFLIYSKIYQKLYMSLMLYKKDQKKKKKVVNQSGQVQLEWSF